MAELPHPGMDAIGVPDRVADAIIAFLALVIVTSVSMVFGELVPKYLAVARPLPTARAVVGPQLLFSLLLTPADPADQRRGELDRAQAGHRAGRGAAVGPLAAGAAVAGAYLGAQRLAGPGHRVAGASGRCSSAT